MKRVRFSQRDSTATVLTGATLGVLAGVALGAFLAQRLGGIGGVLQRVRRRIGPALRAAEEDEDPRTAVYELDQYAHEAYAGEDLDDEDADDDLDEDDLDEDDLDEDDLDEDELEEDEAESSQAVELEERVLDAFMNDPILEECAIEIAATPEGIVELNGWVEESEHASHAGTIARGVPGVTAVANNVRVRGVRRRQQA